MSSHYTYVRRWRTQPLAAFLGSVLWVAVAMGALAMAFPLFWMLSGSLKTDAEIFAVPIVWLPTHPEFSSYTKAIQMAQLDRAFLNSLIVTVPTVLCSLFFCSLAGYALGKFRHRGLDIIFGGMLAMMMVPFTVILVPLYIITRDLHLLETLPGLMLPRLMSAFGIFLFRQMMMAIPDDLIDAGIIDGCSEFGIYWRIALPLNVPAIAALGILSFQWSWNDFLWPLMVSSSTATRTIPLAVSIFQGSSEHGATPYNQLMAAATVSLAPLIVAFVVGQRHFVRSIALSGLKG